MIDQFYNTLFIGKVAIQLKAVDSTNNYAKDLLAKSNPTEGTVVIADQQTAGRGQLGSSWQAEACQNITLSVILYPKFLLAAEQFALNAAAALAVHDFLKVFELPAAVRIKWPNDIYVGQQKIAGILIENQLRGRYLQSSILGIGININQEAFPDHLPNPSSLYLLTEKKYEISELLFQLYATLERQYLEIRNGNIKALRTRYTNLMFQLGELKPYYLHKEKRTEYGVVEGIDQYGHLLVQFENRLQAFDLKEISPLLRE